MKNSYGSRLRKNNRMREKNIEERTKNVYPLSHYINNGKKLNINSGFNKVEIKKRGIYYINQNSNLLLNSYNQSSDYLKNNQANKNYNNSNCKTEYNTINRLNNHSLFDSNKQKIINQENNNHNYVRFISKNKNDKEMENETYYDSKHNKEYKYNNYRSTNNNKFPLCTIRSFHKSHEDMEKFGKFDKLKIGDNYKINGRKNYINRNNTYERKDNIDENSLSRNKRNQTYYNYINNNNKEKNSINYKRSNHVKNHPSLQNNRNLNYQNKNNNTEMDRNDDFSQSKNKYENQNTIRNINYLKRNYTENNYLTENSEEKDLNRKKNIFIKDRNDIKMKSIENYSPNNDLLNSPEFIKYNNKRNKEYNKNINKTNTNTSKILKEHKLILPIKLNIKDKNKEKLSRIKRIIEKSSTNQNFYQIDLHKYFNNKVIKSIDEKNKNKKVTEKANKPIFKKKKIKMHTKEENKDEGIFYENNFLVTSPINQTRKYKPNILLNNKIKDNNQIQSLVASYNLFIEKDGNEKKNTNKINNENKLSSKETEHTSYLNKTFKKKKVYQKKKNTNNNNVEDTISLSYSKEQNMSFNSKKERNNNNVEENSISLPFFIESFNIFYNKKSKRLIINDKEKDNENKCLKNNDNDSDEDYYQLTKEILLLKKGLAKKSELSKEIKRKLKDIRPQRIYKLSLIGSKGIYKKKRSNYKQNNHF